MGRVCFRIYAPSNSSQHGKHSYYVGNPIFTHGTTSVTERFESASVQVYHNTTLRDLRMMIDRGIRPETKSNTNDVLYFMHPTRLRSEILLVAANADNLFQRDERDRTKYGFTSLRSKAFDVMHSQDDLLEISPNIIGVEDEPIVEIFGQFTVLDLIIVPLMFVHPSTNAIILSGKCSDKQETLNS